MTSLTRQKGRLVARSGSLGTEQGCCCNFNCDNACSAPCTNTQCLCTLDQLSECTLEVWAYYSNNTSELADTGLATDVLGKTWFADDTGLCVYEYGLESFSGGDGGVCYINGEPTEIYDSIECDNAGGQFKLCKDTLSMGVCIRTNNQGQCGLYGFSLPVPHGTTPRGDCAGIEIIASCNPLP